MDWLYGLASGLVRVNKHGQGSVSDVIKIVVGNEGGFSNVSRQTSLVAFRRCCCDMQVSSFKFEGQGQRATPVASPKTLKLFNGSQWSAMSLMILRMLLIMIWPASSLFP